MHFTWFIQEIVTLFLWNKALYLLNISILLSLLLLFLTRHQGEQFSLSKIYFMHFYISELNIWLCLVVIYNVLYLCCTLFIQSIDTQHAQQRFC